MMILRKGKEMSGCTQVGKSRVEEGSGSKFTEMLTALTLLGILYLDLDFRETHPPG